MQPQPRAAQSDSQLGLAVYRNVLLMDMRGQLDGVHVLRIGDIYGELLEYYPRLVALCVARPGIPIGTAQARGEGAKVARQFGAKIERVAIVIEGGGVMARLIRTTVRAFSTVARNAPIAMYDDVAEGVSGLSRFVISDTPQVEQELSNAFLALRGSSP
jgi:hypothetical protein